MARHGEGVVISHELAGEEHDMQKRQWSLALAIWRAFLHIRILLHCLFSKCEGLDLEGEERDMDEWQWSLSRAIWRAFFAKS